jgi:hypothetical protein
MHTAARLSRRNVHAASAESVMALEVETMIAARLADDLTEAIENLDTLCPYKAAANLRHTLIERCLFYRGLMRQHPSSRDEIRERLKREQMMLAFAREFRRAPANASILQ